MATAAQLRDRPGGGRAYVLAVSGANWYAVEVAEQPASWRGSGTGTQNPATRPLRGGMHVAATLTRTLDPTSPSIEPQSLSVELADLDGVWTTEFRLRASGARTQVTANVDRDDTTITVRSTAAFGAVGTVLTGWVGHEAMRLRVATATTFTVVDPSNDVTPSTSGRGLWGPAPGSRWASTHLVDADNARYPELTATADTWYGRLCCLWETYLDDDGTWLDRSRSILRWAGHIRTLSYDPARCVWRLECEGIEAMLRRQLFAGGWEGEIQGVRFGSADSRALSITEVQITAGPTVTVVGADHWTIPAGNYELDAVISWYNQQMVNSTMITGKWGIALVSPPGAGGEPRVELRVSGLGANVRYANVGMGQVLATVLGLPGIITIPTSSGAGTFVAPRPPLCTYISPQAGATYTLTHEIGIWTNQSDWPGWNGFVRIGDSYWAVTKSGTSLTLAALLRGEPPTEPEARIKVKQVWHPRDVLVGGNAGYDAIEFLLAALLSTGTPAWAHATYDAFSRELGLGFPPALLDVASFETLRQASGGALLRDWWFEEAVTLADLLVTEGRTLGFGVVWKNGMLCARQVGYDLADNAVRALTDADTLEGGAVGYAIAGVLNRASIQDRDDNRAEINLTASQIRYGTTRSLDVKHDGIRLYDPQFGDAVAAWGAVALGALERYSEPNARIDLGCGPSMVDLAPGDVVTLTRSDLPDMASGSMGLVAAPMRVVAVEQELEGGSVRLGLLHQQITGLGPIAPSMLAVSYDMWTFTVTVAPNEYTDSGADIDHFAVGDLVRIVERDPEIASIPQYWDRTIQSIAGNTFVVDGHLTGWDANRSYIVESQLYSVATSTQRANSYLADDADQQVENLRDPYRLT